MQDTSRAAAMGKIHVALPLTYHPLHQTSTSISSTSPTSPLSSILSTSSPSSQFEEDVQQHASPIRGSPYPAGCSACTNRLQHCEADSRAHNQYSTNGETFHVARNVTKIAEKPKGLVTKTEGITLAMITAGLLVIMILAFILEKCRQRRRRHLHLDHEKPHHQQPPMPSMLGGIDFSNASSSESSRGSNTGEGA